MPLLLGSEEHTSELQSPCNLVCRLLLEKKKTTPTRLRMLAIALVPLSAPAADGAAAWMCRCGGLERDSGVGTAASKLVVFFFFNDTGTPEIYTLSLHGALPI